jgi:hypothetical protein
LYQHSADLPAQAKMFVYIEKSSLASKADVLSVQAVELRRGVRAMAARGVALKVLPKDCPFVGEP